MIYSILYALCFFICYIPQIYKTVKYKNVDGLSMAMFVVSLFGYIFLGLNLISKQDLDIGIIANVVIGTICCLTLIFYIIKYKKR